MTCKKLRALLEPGAPHRAIFSQLQGDTYKGIPKPIFAAAGVRVFLISLDRCAKYNKDPAVDHIVLPKRSHVIRLKSLEFRKIGW